jgi:hypothetical protein
MRRSRGGAFFARKVKQYKGFERESTLTNKQQCNPENSNEKFQKCKK